MAVGTRERKKGGRPRNLNDPIRNYRLRDWYLAHQTEVSVSLVAYEMGWFRRSGGREGAPDETRVRRALGVMEQSPSVKKGVRYRGRHRRWIEREDAVRLCRAMGAAPVDVGL
jgi:hypothetical protein